MFSYSIDIYEKRNGAWAWYSLAGWTRPFTDGTRLDETLDSGSINLVAVERSKAIKPFTKLRIIISENNEEKERIYRLVTSTKKTRKTYYGTPLYDWTINTIELTKLLERRIISTMTTTKYLSNNYSTLTATTKWVGGAASLEAIGVSTKGSVSNYPIYIPIDLGNSINAPIITAMFNLPPDQQLHSYSYYGTYDVRILDDGGNAVATKTGTAVSTSSLSYTPTAPGNYTIEYKFNVRDYYRGVPTDEDIYYGITYHTPVSVVENAGIKNQPTITSVCERLLSAGVVRRAGIENQEFLLEPTFAEEYETVLSPEFSFTNCTLFEALMQVGGYIHAIPRLIPRSTKYDTHYYVTFDKLGGDEQAPQMPPFVYSEQTIDVNDWAGKIDSPSQNLCNTEDIGNGAITELGNAYITVRTEEGQVEINADNILIRTSRPIQKILKVECGYVGGSVVGDITSYVYESSEYQTLSSYWGSAYPYSKAYAIYYSQGDNKINGLTFRLQNATSTSTAFSKYAIVNIINAKTGSNYSTVNGEWMRKLAFKVTYIPIVEARVTAQKPYLTEGGSGNNVLTYNQGANLAETSFYGEKMRGAIARLGHGVETRTYDIFRYSQLPKIGQLLDGKYIAHIDYEYDITKIRITLALTKDFNMLSQFVGLDSNYRLYDISEKQSVERNITYNELIVFGEKPNIDMSNFIMFKRVPRLIESMLSISVVGGYVLHDKKLQVVKMIPYDKLGNEIPGRAVILPVIAFPFGTSICFNFALQDNYGAGYQSSNEYESETNKAVQRLVPYTDTFGEIGEIQLEYTANVNWSVDATTQNDGGAAMLYPQLTGSVTTGDITTGSNHIVIEKDSREQINFTYQAHFVATRPSIVLSSGLSKYSDFVNPASFKDANNQEKKTIIVWLKHKINGLNKYVEPTDEELFEEYTNQSTTENGSFKFVPSTCLIDDCESYAVCKSDGGSTGYIVPSGTQVYSDVGLTTSAGTLSSSVIAAPVSGNSGVCTATVEVENHEHYSQEEEGLNNIGSVEIVLSHEPNVSTLKGYYIPRRIDDLGDDYIELAPGDGWSYDSATNTATFTKNARGYKVEYDTVSTYTENTVYMSTTGLQTITTPTKLELLFGENFDEPLNIGDTPNPIYITGAIAQACEQNLSERLRFAPTGKSYWYLLPSLGSGGVMGTLANDYIPDFENPVIIGANVYYPIPNLYGTPPGSTVQKQAYVREQDLVSAYDLE